MERLFWVECPRCGCRFYCDYALRHSPLALICPRCGCSFHARESPWIDERARGASGAMAGASGPMA